MSEKGERLGSTNCSYKNSPGCTCSRGNKGTILIVIQGVSRYQTDPVDDLAN